MKIHEQIRELEHYGPDLQLAVTYAVDDALARQLPQLALPTMDDAARSAFRALLAYEAYCSVRDTLALVEARGYSVHPCDWIPEFRWQYAGRHPKVYQPWTDYLSENEYTRFHGGNSLTIENCHRFAPRQRVLAFSAYRDGGDPDKLEYAKALIKSQPANIRVQLLKSVNATGACYGGSRWHVPFIQEFLDDKAASVRKIAKSLLNVGGGWKSEEEYAQVVAAHLMVTDDKVTFREPPKFRGFLSKEFSCISFAGLAKALGLSSKQLAERADIDGLGPNFSLLLGVSGDVEARSIVASRALDAGKGGQSIPLSWFEGIDTDTELWRRGLEAMKDSPYVFSVQEYLGDKTGTMSADEMLQWHEFEKMRTSVMRHLETGELPVNIVYDPLRFLATVVDKEAAQIILDEAISLGMAPDNPRFTMLRLNLAL